MPLGVPSCLYMPLKACLNVSEEMGENQPGPKSKAFLNNLSVKIAHNSAELPGHMRVPWQIRSAEPISS